MRHNRLGRDVCRARPVGHKACLLVSGRRSGGGGKRKAGDTDVLQPRCRQDCGTAAGAVAHGEEVRQGEHRTDCAASGDKEVQLRAHLLQPRLRLRHLPRAQTAGQTAHACHQPSHRRRRGKHGVLIHSQHGRGSFLWHDRRHEADARQHKGGESGVEGHKAAHVHKRRGATQRPCGPCVRRELRLAAPLRGQSRDY